MDHAGGLSQGAAECPAGADSCATTTITCAEDDQCACHQRLEGGVRCVQFTLNQGECDQCATDADCRKLGFPPGSSCIKDDGAECSCEADDRGFCGEPCGFVGPDTGIKRSATRGPR